MKFDVSNIDFQTFDNILWSLLNEHPPLKQKHLRGKNAGIVTKYMREAIMRKWGLRNHFCKYKTESSTISYNWQWNFYSSLLRKSKTFYFQNLDNNVVNENTKLWKNESTVFQTIQSRKKKSLLLKTMKSYLKMLEWLKFAQITWIK